MLRILIADDHAIVRKGLKQILEETSDMAVTDEASTGQDTLEKIRKNEYDVVVLDISMPGKSGLDILREVKNEKPTLPILILSMHPEEQYAVRMLKGGAAGYLTKESAPEELVEAIRKVSLGRKYITHSLAEKLAFDLERNSDKKPHELLSNREFQVLCMIASGKTIKEIGQSLFLSVKTISTYRSRILEKLKLKNNVEITHYAIKNRLIH